MKCFFFLGRWIEIVTTAKDIKYNCWILHKHLEIYVCSYNDSQTTEKMNCTNIFLVYSDTVEVSQFLPSYPPDYIHYYE